MMRPSTSFKLNRRAERERDELGRQAGVVLGPQREQPLAIGRLEVRALDERPQALLGDRGPARELLQRLVGVRRAALAQQGLDRLAEDLPRLAEIRSHARR